MSIYKVHGVIDGKYWPPYSKKYEKNTPKDEDLKKKKKNVYWEKHKCF